jgi:hypothetical protein
MLLRTTSYIAIAATAASSPAFGFKPAKELDHSKTAEKPGFVFVPKFGLDRGQTFFTSFQETVSPPAKSAYGDFIKFRVTLTPTAISDGSYKSFLGNQWRDDPTVLVPQGANNCFIAKEALERLKHMTEPLNPKIVSGSYPEPCSAVFTVLPEEAEDFKTFLASQSVLGIQYEVSLCEPSSPVIETGAFWEALSTELRAKIAGIQKGFRYVLPLWRTAAEAWALASRKPELLPGDKDANAVEAFLDKFDLDPAARTLSEEENILSLPTTICTKKVLKVSRGLP